MATSATGHATHSHTAQAARRRALLGGLAAVTAVLAACESAPAPDDPFLTRAERTDYRETSSHADVVDFLQRAAASSPSVHYTTFGYTNEGRALPLAVVGDVADASPASVRASGRTVVYLQGNIHAGEVCGKEALQMLLRDIMAGSHDANGASRWSCSSGPSTTRTAMSG